MIVSEGVAMVEVASSRSPEEWMALLAGALYVFRKSQTLGIGRFIECGISGLLGFAVGPDAAEWAGLNHALGTLLITTLGYLALDATRSLVADRAFFKDILLRFLGGRHNGGD